MFREYCFDGFWSFSNFHYLFILLRNIQVENPLAVLDQEEAKTFLTCKAEDKYASFMKAIDLERFDRTFSATIDHVQEVRDSQENIKDKLLLNFYQVAELKKKSDALDKMEDKVSEMKVKLAWALFTTVDKEATLSSDVSITSCAVFLCTCAVHPRLRCYVALHFI
jgi:hypothetical protein